MRTRGVRRFAEILITFAGKNIFRYLAFDDIMIDLGYLHLYIVEGRGRGKGNILLSLTSLHI